MILTCQRCRDDVLPILARETFADGTSHIKATCPLCYRFIKWVPRATYHEDKLARLLEEKRIRERAEIEREIEKDKPSENP